MESCMGQTLRQKSGGDIRESILRNGRPRGQRRFGIWRSFGYFSLSALKCRALRTLSKTAATARRKPVPIKKSFAFSSHDSSAVAKGVFSSADVGLAMD